MQTRLIEYKNHQDDSYSRVVCASDKELIASICEALKENPDIIKIVKL